MTRRKNPKAAENEARLQEALAAVRSGQCNAPTASTVFNVPRRTLYDRLEGKLPCRLAQENQQVLTHAEEKELVRMITYLTITGYPPRHATLREMAEEVRKRRVQNINDPSVNYVEYPPIGKDWIKRFLRRHSELSSVTARTIDASRVKAATPETISHWFNVLEQVIDEYNIIEENTYNMDESGFAIGEIEATKCIVNSRVRQHLQAKPGRQEWVSSVECICADGTSIPPLIIFKAQNLNYQWIPASIADDWRFACNSKGWTSNDHGMQWLRRCFEPSTRDKAHGRYRLLICDGHDSHVTGEFIAHYMEHKIVLMILPPHSSHLTQPLDVGIFGPLKKVMASKIAPLINTGVARLQKVEWTSAFVQAHQEVFNIQNIQSAFLGAGIFPFNPEKILSHLTLPATTPSHQLRESTPTTDTLFNQSVLTSSPIDGNAVHLANVALNALVDSGELFNTPAKRYIKCLSRSSERLRAANSILQKQNEDMHQVLSQRKERLSGKRMVIKGQHLLSVIEMRDGVLKAQEATRKRKAVMEKTSRKRKCKAIEESSEDYESHSEHEADEEAEILDCIEVEM